MKYTIHKSPLCSLPAAALPAEICNTAKTARKTPFLRRIAKKR
jgi:hypothetical protein